MWLAKLGKGMLFSLEQAFEGRDLPPPQAFPGLSGDWGTREKREGGMMGTSVERERGVMGRKRRERGKRRFSFSPLPITPFISAFLNN